MKNNKILLFPYFDNTSPYVEMIVNEFKEYCDVAKAINLSFFPLTRNYLHFRPDFIHFDWFHMYYSNPKKTLITYFKVIHFICDLLILRLLKSNIFISLHNLKPHDSKYSYIDFYCYKLILYLSKRIRFFSKYNKKLGCRYFNLDRSKTVVFYESRYISSQKFKEKLNFNKTNFLIFGQIRPYKKIFEFLENNQSYIKKNLDVNFFIIGNAYDKIYFNKISNFIFNHDLKNVILIDLYVKSSQISNFISKFDYVLNTSEKNYNSGILSHCIPLNIPYISKKQYGIEERMNNNKDFLYNVLNESFLKKVNDSKNLSNLYLKEYPQTKEFSKFLFSQEL